MEKSSCTLKDVARVAGVSIGTASKVVNNIYVNPKSKAAVDDAVKQLGYVPNALARGLKSSSTKTIGVLLPDIANPINAKVFRGINSASRKLGYSVLFSEFCSDDENVPDYLKLFVEKKVDGIIYASSTVTQNIEQELLDFGKPVVLTLTYSENNTFSSINLDNEQAAYEMTRHLLDKGHRKILMLAGMYGDANAGDARLNGFKRAFSEIGIDNYDENLIIRGVYTFERGYEDVKKAIEEKKDFTAIFAVADTIAIGAMRAVHEAKLKVPEDISVAGFDGIDYANYTNPALFTLEQPFVEYGEESVKLLVEILNDNTVKRNINLDFRIRENKSVIECGRK